MYEIEMDCGSGLVAARLGGMMDLDEVASYIADLRRGLVANRLRDYVMVIDVTSCPIQTQAMLDAMAAHMAAMPKARRIAVVVASSLAKWQVRRLFRQPYARLVDDVAAARAWAVSGEEPT